MDPLIGQIILFAGVFAPRGWAFCDGRLLAIESCEALFSLIGTTYGGDGRVDFALPDLRGCVPAGPAGIALASMALAGGGSPGHGDMPLRPGPSWSGPSPNFIIALEGVYPSRG